MKGQLLASFCGRYWRPAAGGCALPRLFLAAAAWVYEAGARARRNLYRRGWRAKKTLPAPIISVGNLRVGGTGKTPVTAHLARFFQARGLKVAVLSRGYGGHKLAVTCVSDGRRLFHAPPAVGEEAYLLARTLPGVIVYTGRSRYEAGLAAWEAHRPDVFLLDDGFQHLPLERDLEVVLLDAEDPLDHGRLLPAGPLREPWGTLREADVLLLTRYDPGRHEKRLIFFRQTFPQQKIFTADIVPAGLRDVPEGGLAPPAKLRGVPALAFAGLARPEVFRQTLISLGVELCGFRAFPDHHAYTPQELKALEEEARGRQAAVLLTTSKDWARMAERWTGQIPLWVLEVEARIKPEIPFQEYLLTTLTASAKGLPGGTMKRPFPEPSGSRQPVPPLVRRRWRQLSVTGARLPEPSRVKALVVRVPNWVGDAVMSLPVLSGLAAIFPQASITVLADPRVAPLFEAVPQVTEIIPYPRAREKWRVLLNLRGAFDLALTLPNSLEAALGLFLTRTPSRLGYAADLRSPLLTTVIRNKRALKGLHQIFYYLGLLTPFGEMGDFSPPRLQLSEEAQAMGRTLLSGRGLEGGGPQVGLAPGASYGPAKRWPPERFAAAAHILAREFKAGIILLGGPGDRDAALEVQRLGKGRFLDLAGRTTLKEALAVLSQLDLLLTNDSGLMHVAAALEVPVVALFGSTSPRATGPFSSRAVVLQHPVPCAPCFQRTCSRDYACLKAIEVEEVVAAARQLLSVPQTEPSKILAGETDVQK